MTTLNVVGWGEPELALEINLSNVFIVPTTFVSSVLSNTDSPMPSLREIGNRLLIEHSDWLLTDEELLLILNMRT